MSQNEMKLGSQKEWFIIVVIIIDSLWVKLIVFGLTTKKYHFIFCHFYKAGLFSIVWLVKLRHADKFHWQIFLILSNYSCIPHNWTFLPFIKRNIHSVFFFFFFTFIIWWTLSQLVVSFACFIMWSCSSLTLIPCVQCVCVCMCEAEHVSFLFSPLSQSSLDHTEFKRCGPFDPYINAKVCTHDLWPARFTSICHAWVCLVSVGTVSLHSFSCLWLII